MRRGRYADRVDAGRELVAHLPHLVGPGALVLGLPRGGVPVAAEVARASGGELDVLVVRKVGVPGHEELALGAVAGGGLRVLNDDVVTATGLAPATVEALVQRAAADVAGRAGALRGDRPSPVLAGRTVVLVDDGMATGATMRVAARAVRAAGPAALVVAVPVGPRATCESFAGEADAVVCPRTPEPFTAVGAWYDDFDQTTDDEVRRLLAGGPGSTSPEA